MLLSPIDLVELSLHFRDAIEAVMVCDPFDRGR